MRGIIMAIVGLGCAAATACLSDGGRPGGDADTSDTQGDTGEGDTSSDTSGDTGQDTSGDTGQDTSGDTSDGDRCANVECDDGDPCTFDQCNAATGACEHYAVPGSGDVPGVPLPSCLSDADCFDGNDCTTDTCVDGGGCGIGASYCTYTSIPGCGLGCAAGCDDGNPCTRDECFDDTCSSFYEEGCVAECVGLDAVPLEVLIGQGGFYPDPVQTTGALDFYRNTTVCNDGPTCDCDGIAALQDGDWQIALRSPANSTLDEAWECRSSGCVEVQAACTPAHYGVRYRAWGRGLAEWELFTPGASGDGSGSGADEVPGADPAVPVPPPMVAGLEVQGFCLETDDDALVGFYEGIADMAGLTLTFDAEVSQTQAGFFLTWNHGECQGCPAGLDVSEGRAPMRVFDGYVEVDVAIAGLAQTLRLYSNRNALYGTTVSGGGGVTPFIALPAGPHMTLTRLP